MNTLINIQEDISRLHAAGVLDRLLVDKTTRKNIMWATDAYSSFGKPYERDEEIRPPFITGAHAGQIKTRARKAFEQQSARTRQHAEVFTPLWVCKRMIDHADEIWFGRPGVFDAEDEPVQFPKGKKWQHYVDSRRLEITCGEAPYLVSRYDVATGEIIPVQCRIGILDRKLRVVSENTETETEWLRWAVRAFQATYGYEFQGDNLLIARVNMMMSFAEHLEYRWHREPVKAEYRKLANIVAWNLWQMDGLAGTLPYRKAEEEFPQFTLFDQMGIDPAELNRQPRSRIFDWRRENSLEFKCVNTGGRNMKFDFVIGNPPYQEETVEEESSTNGQAPRKNVFHYFQMAIDNIAENGTVLIYPGGRWLHRSGKGMEEFGLKQINDPHLQEITYFPDSKEIFHDVDISDGITIVVKNMKKVEPGFHYAYTKAGKTIGVDMQCPGTDLLPFDPRDLIITKKIDQLANSMGLKYLHDKILPRSLFGIESTFADNNPDKIIPLEKVASINYEKQIKLLTNDKSGPAGRIAWFVVDKDVIKKGRQYISEWQVIVSSAHPGGQEGRDRQLSIVDNHSAFGRSRVALASFQTKSEAENFYKYVSTYLVRFLFLMTDENLTSLAKRVPDFEDYSDQNKLIDFSKDLNDQLYQIFALSVEDVEYVESVVNNLRRKGKEMA